MTADNSEAKSIIGTPVPGWTPELGSRIQEVITTLGGLRSACQIAGVTDEQIARWRDGRSKPNFFGIAMLAKAAGVSLDWVWTGRDEMAAVGTYQPVVGRAFTPTVGTAVAPVVGGTVAQIDEELLARIGEEIAEAYRAENARIGQRQLARLQARIYSDLVQHFTPDQRETGLKGMMIGLRRDLRSPQATGDTDSKRLA